MTRAALLLCLSATLSHAQVPATTLAGRVTRAADATPVAGAAVSATPSEGGKPRTTRSASDGTWTLAQVPEGTWDVAVRARGFLDGGAWRVEVTAGATARADVALVEGGTITGLVTDEAGRPIAGAVIDDDTRTDASGRYRLTGVSPPRRAIRAAAPGHVSAFSEGVDVVAGATVEAPPIVLPTGSIVSGRVIDRETGEPIAGASVSFWGRLDEPSWAHAETDSAGRFRVDTLREGEHGYSVHAEGRDDGQGATTLSKAAPVDLGDLTLRLLPPRLGLYADRLVFAPGQALRAYFNAFRVPAFTMTVSRIDPDAALRRGRADDLAGASGTLVKQLRVPVAYERALREVNGRSLTIAPLPPGFYAVKLVADGGLQASTWMQVTDLAMVAKQAGPKALLWTASFAGSRARAGVEITSWPDGTVLGRTDARGVLAVERAPDAEPLGLLVARDPARPESVALVTGARDAPAPTLDRWRAYVETDRPIYRPGHVVSYKLTVRSDDRGRYGIAAPPSVRLSVNAPDGTTPLDQDVTLSSSGSFAGEIPLKDVAPLGFWSIGVRFGDEDAPEQATVEGGSFRVEEYRKPEMRVAAQLAPSRVVGGETLTASIDASFWFGSPAAGAKVRYDVYATPWSATGLFDEGADDADDEWGWEGSAEAGFGEMVLTGEARADAAGRVTFPVATKRATDGDRRYQLVARVTDSTGREVAASGEATVTRADVALDVRTTSSVFRPDEDIPLEIRARTYDGAPVATEVVVKVFEERWRKGRSTSLQLLETRVTTDASGLARTTVRAGAQGYLRLFAQAKDAGGRLTDATSHAWSVGPGWRLDEYGFRDLQLVTDKASYRPGETARVLVNSTVPDVDVLLTLEGSDIRERLVTLQGASALVEIPILATHAPTLHLVATSVASRRFRTTQRALPVSPADRVLSVSVEPDQPVRRPREEATFRVTTRDASGRGVPAEVSLAVVDESIFALSRELTPDVRAAFWGPRPNHVTTWHSFPRRYEGGADKWKPEERRRSFRDTALWVPALATGDDGTATATVTLPDNLTEWRATARAITADTAVGQARGRLVVRKELMVRLNAPRFFRTGDVTTLRASVHDETDAPMSVSWRAKAEGLEILGAASGTVEVGARGAAPLELRVRALSAPSARIVLETAAPPHADAIEIDVPVMPFGRIVTDHASGATRDRDTATITLPDGADPRATSLRVRVSSSLATAMLDSLVDLDRFPYGCVEQTLSGFLPALSVKRAFDAVGADALARMEAASPEALEVLGEGLPRRIETGILRLRQMQHVDGGWGWWTQDPTHRLLTAHALQGLGQARDLGASVPDDVLERARGAVGRMLAAPGEPAADARHRRRARAEAVPSVATDPDERAALLLALALSGGLDDVQRAEAAALMSSPDVGAWGLAQAVLATSASGDDASAGAARLVALATHEGDRAHWAVPPERRHSWTGSEVETTALAARAILAATPQADDRDAVVAAALRFLGATRQGSWWGTTKDTAAAVETAVAWIRANPDELGSASRVRLALNAKPLAEMALGIGATSTRGEAVNVDPALLATGANALEIRKSREHGGAARAWWSADLEAVVAGQAPSPESAGFTIERSYRLVAVRVKDGAQERVVTEWSPDKGPLRPGDRLEVRLRVTADHPWSFVMIEDPLPSGFEVEDAFGHDASPWSESSWGWWFARREVRDEKVAFFATSWPSDAGGPEVREITYTLRAELPGIKHVQPATASLMYFPDVRGASSSAIITVSE